MSEVKKRPLRYRIGRKWGYLTVGGDVLRKASYDYTSKFKNGLGFVIENGAFSIINEAMQVLGVVQYPVSSYGAFSEGLLVVENIDNEKCFYIDSKGQKQFGKEFDNALSFSENRAFVKVGKKWGMLDNTGRWVARPAFHWAQSFQENSNITSVCPEADGPWHLLDRDGNAVSTRRFDLLRCVSEGLVPFGKKINGRMRFGVADETGEEIVPPTFCECDDGFRNGCLGVETEDGTWGVIDKSGHWIIHPKYLYIGECRDGSMLAYKGGERTLDRHLKDGKFGFVDTANQVKIDFQFDEAFPFHDGIARVNWYVDANSENYDTLMGYVSIDGRVIWREQQSNSK